MRPLLRQILFISSFAIAVMSLVPAAYAQGCTMCRDTTAGSAPQVRAALRKAIPILGIPAVTLFLAVLAVARHSDRRSNQP